MADGIRRFVRNGVVRVRLQVGPEGDGADADEDETGNADVGRMAGRGGDFVGRPEALDAGETGKELDGRMALLRGDSVGRTTLSLVLSRSIPDRASMARN